MATRSAVTAGDAIYARYSSELQNPRSCEDQITELRQAIEAFIAAYNPKAKPFKWRKREVKGSQLRNTIVNLCN